MLDSRMYPLGSGGPKGLYVKDVAIVIDGAAQTLRRRLSAAQINAGVELVPAVPGVKHRLIDAALISVGAAAAGATSVDIKATLAGSARNLVAAAIAGLGQSVLARMGAANIAVLADGASLTANDANTAITAGKTGPTLTGSTFVEVVLTYASEKAA